MITPLLDWLSSSLALLASPSLPGKLIGFPSWAWGY